jgi:hypothetical protein
MGSSGGVPYTLPGWDIPWDTAGMHNSWRAMHLGDQAVRFDLYCRPEAVERCCLVHAVGKSKCEVCKGQFPNV